MSLINCLAFSHFKTLNIESRINTMFPHEREAKINVPKITQSTQTETKITVPKRSKSTQVDKKLINDGFEILPFTGESQENSAAEAFIAAAAPAEAAASAVDARAAKVNAAAKAEKAAVSSSSAVTPEEVPKVLVVPKKRKYFETQVEFVQVDSLPIKKRPRKQENPRQIL